MARLSKIMPYLRKTLFVLALGLLIGILVLLWNRHRLDVCKVVEVDITVPLDKQLISEFHIQEYLEEWYPGGLLGIAVSDIDLHDIEERLKALPAVRNAEVSYQINGVLQIDIDQKIPIVRCYLDENSSFYLDYLGGRISSDSHDPARVPVAMGQLTEEMIKKVYTLATYVQENPFTEAIVEQIFVTVDGDLIVIPKFKGQQIIVGDATELDVKFRKLEFFYKNGLNHIGWDKYKTINLKYANQIVCN